MASCATCGSTILFGGIKSGPLRFCSQQCAGSSALAQLMGALPEHEVRARAEALRDSRCGVCHGPGPIDVHISYRVWSAVVLTKWVGRPRLSCHRCARKRLLADAVFSLVLGWWGFPFGLLMTPIFIIRNLVMLLAPERPGQKASDKLLLEARFQLAQERMRAPAPAQPDRAVIGA